MPNLRTMWLEIARADGAGGVPHRVGQLHLLAALQQGRGVAHDLGVQGVGHLVAALDRAVGLVGARVGADQQRVEVEVVEVLAAAETCASRSVRPTMSCRRAEAQRRPGSRAPPRR